LPGGNCHKIDLAIIVYQAHTTASSHRHGLIVKQWPRRSCRGRARQMATNGQQTCTEQMGKVETEGEGRSGSKF
jgi:hypothetical protein